MNGFNYTKLWQIMAVFETGVTANLLKRTSNNSNCD